MLLAPNDPLVLKGDSNSFATPASSNNRKIL